MQLATLRYAKIEGTAVSVSVTSADEAKAAVKELRQRKREQSGRGHTQTEAQLGSVRAEPRAGPGPGGADQHSTRRRPLSSARSTRARSWPRLRISPVAATTL